MHAVRAYTASHPRAAQKAALLEVTSAAQTKFKMKGCLVEEYDPSTATATSLIKRIKFLAMTKSPRGQGFRTIALAPPPSATGLAITNKIAAQGAADLKDDCDAGKVCGVGGRWRQRGGVCRARRARRPSLE